MNADKGANHATVHVAQNPDGTCKRTVTVMELKRYTGAHQRRVKTMLRVGMEALSINRIAEVEKVPSTTLRLDLTRFSHGGLRELLACRLAEDGQMPRLRRTFSLLRCSDSYHEANEQAPAGEAAKAFLKETGCHL